MASQIDICNLALSILGKPPITNILQGNNSSQVLNVEYDMLRRGLLEGPGTWRFSIKRAVLPQLASQPISGPYTVQYQLPSDNLRILQVGNVYPGLDLSDYVLGPTDSDYSQEGNILLCDYGGPLGLVYVADITDPTQFNANFVIYLAAKLAWTCCERLTGSDAKQEAANKRMMMARSDAGASNAFLVAPQNLADDTWIACRMQ